MSFFDGKPALTTAAEGISADLAAITDPTMRACVQYTIGGILTGIVGLGQCPPSIGERLVDVLPTVVRKLPFAKSRDAIGPEFKAGCSPELLAMIDAELSRFKERTP